LSEEAWLQSALLLRSASTLAAPCAASVNTVFTGAPTSTVDTVGTPRAQACRKTLGIPSYTEVSTKSRARSNHGSTPASGRKQLGITTASRLWLRRQLSS